ncbi:hypothetical protein TNCT_65111 [Trichonephila clavata]|uniref:Uncharacterized protein n=1 Tax=Trichonephila clavata TaxID=2740835 RepID=A0A8X6IRD1_TRICU|nr:hypothetical protein TNCT_65111 [Trichonephila clavata]
MDQIAKLEQHNKSRVPTAASAPKPKQRRKLKRATVSPTLGDQGKKSRLEQSLPSLTFTLSEGEISLMEETDSSDDCSEFQDRQKDITPNAIPGLSGSAVIGDVPSNLDEASYRFYSVEMEWKKWKRHDMKKPQEGGWTSGRGRTNQGGRRRGLRPTVVERLIRAKAAEERGCWAGAKKTGKNGEKSWKKKKKVHDTEN